MFKNYNGTRTRLNGSGRIVADGSVAIALKYLGASPSATYTVVSATGITLKQGTAGAEAVDTTVGASANGVVDFATDNTIAKVVDRINASPNWRAEVVDALRADSVASSAMLAISATTINRRSALAPLYWDSSAHLGIEYRISARRLNFYRSQKKPGQGGPFQSFLRQATCFCNIGSGALTLRVYEVTSDSSQTATLIASKDVTDSVITDLYATVSDAASMRSSFGNDLLVTLRGTGDFPDSGMYLEVNGYVE